MGIILPARITTDHKLVQYMKSNLLYRTLIIVAIAATNIACDQVTKKWATNTLQGKPTEVYLNDFFRLTYVMNDGAFLSLGSDLPGSLRFWTLKVFPVALLVGLFFYLVFSKTMSIWQIIAFSFILGGGISNIYDRLLYGEVVDFMNLGIPNWIRTGIFNFADTSIMTGFFMMIPSFFTQGKKT